MIYSQGSGPPLVVVPGIQGRWEWLAPALDHLSRTCRTVSYTLAGDAGATRRLDRSLGFENYLRQIDEVLERSALERAAICGISYGGFIALRYAATRPERVSSLILSSSPSPGWRPNPRQQQYVSRPWLSTPVFLATAPARLLPEIVAAHDGAGPALAFCTVHMARVLAAPPLPGLMGARIREQQGDDFTPDCARIRMPTLVTSGEPELDTVVPVETTRRYLSLIPHAKYAMIERTGHLGLLTRPAAYAAIVSEFVHANHH